MSHGIVEQTGSIMSTTIENQDSELREQVRRRYAQAASGASGAEGCTDRWGGDTVGDPTAASCCGPVGSVDRIFGAGLYDAATVTDLPQGVLPTSLGCGDPLSVAELTAGERVLDLGSGGGLDVLLSARRVGPSGRAYGVDMTREMLDLARENATRAGAENVDFLEGTIEDVPLPDGAVDVVISNCVINLSTDKLGVMSEMFRVLVPGGRIGIADVVAEDRLNAAERAARGPYLGCIAGAPSRSEYLDGLASAGFTDAGVEFTHQAADGMHAAVIRATRPGPPAD